jgi:hypothetical protein
MKKPRKISSDDIVPVDILSMELEQDLPHWLSPVAKYANSAKAKAARQARYDREWAKRKPKK